MFFFYFAFGTVAHRLICRCSNLIRQLHTPLHRATIWCATMMTHHLCPLIFLWLRLPVMFQETHQSPKLWWCNEKRFCEEMPPHTPRVISQSKAAYSILIFLNSSCRHRKGFNHTVARGCLPAPRGELFRNIIKSTRNQGVFTIFWLIWIQMDVCLDPNQLETGKYTLISGWFKKTSGKSLCVWTEWTTANAWPAPSNPKDCYSTIVLRGLKGSFNWAPIILRDASLSDSSTSDWCCLSSLVTPCWLFVWEGQTDGEFKTENSRRRIQDGECFYNVSEIYIWSINNPVHRAFLTVLPYAQMSCYIIN